jgi:toxin ParE1/3/4
MERAYGSPFTGRYLIFHAVRDEALVIERILHGARHLDWVQL